MPLYIENLEIRCQVFVLVVHIKPMCPKRTIDFYTNGVGTQLERRD